MKCPKCNYLGFETGDRCKNCGYNFSLLPPKADSIDNEFELSLRARTEPAGGDDSFDAPLRAASVQEPSRSVADIAAPAVATGASLWQIRDNAALPLFTRPGEELDDQPLIKLPLAPRPPLAVRRGADSGRVRTVPKSMPRLAEPELTFIDETASARADVALSATSPLRPSAFPLSGVTRRLVAAIIDHAMLLAIDVGVVYFTLRMSGLYMSDWRLLPAAPLLVFLGLIMFAYFWAFTAAGGQTIGKMAMKIHVVADDADQHIDGTRALGRTVAGLLSMLTLGLGFVPVFFDPDRRALHDRLAHTRVVRPRST